MNHDLEAIQNENGGGLSHAVTGSYTSVRHAMASRDADKLTGGAAATILRKQGHKITARELVDAYRVLIGGYPEWHHSGFKPGGGMGRTYFYRRAEVDRMGELLPSMAAKMEQRAEVARQEEQRKATTTVQGFFFTWEEERGNYGKIRKVKRLDVYAGPEAGQPRNFTPCDDTTMEKARAAVGRIYRGWDEPTASNL